MAIIERIRCQWSGFTGSPGLTTFYCTDALTLLPAVRTFFNALVTGIPTTAQISFEPFGPRIDDTTGNLTGSWSTGTTPAVVVGTGPGAYAAPAGCLINWLTSSIVNNRFLRGKTFLVPSTFVSTDGTVTPAGVTAMQAAATTLIANAGVLRVWHRPTVAAPSSGSSAPVVGANVPDKIVVLRSRRD
jgi:hypothetical protein